MCVDAAAVRTARLRATRLRGPDLADLPDAVGHHLAVQGQEVRPTLWGLARRLPPSARPGEAAALAVLDDGDVLRTHVLRPTWHLVRPEDVRWLLALTGPHVARVMASTEKAWGLGDAGRGVEVVAAEVATGSRTRAQLAAALVDHGALDPDAPGIAVTHVLMHAELARVLISGPSVGGRPTYAAFDDRVPAGHGPLGAAFDRESAVLELCRRWLPSRAYGTVRDLARWSGLTLTELRAALAVLGDLDEVVEVPGAGDLEGVTLVTTPPVHDATTAGPPSATDPSGEAVADLLCAYDELLSSFGETRHVLSDPRAPEPGRQRAFVHTVLLDGLRAARWRWPGGPPGADGPELQWQRTPETRDLSAVTRVSADLEDFLRAV